MKGRMTREPLAEAFLSALTFEAAFDDAEVERLLQAALAECRSAWPEITLDPKQFAGYLGQRMAPDSSLQTALSASSIPDLYLACGCVAGDAAAVAALDSTYIRRVVAAPFGSVPRVRDAEELAQRLRVRLLVAEAGQAPRIASYTGRGPLNAWLRVAAARLAVDQHRAEVSDSPPTWAVLSGPVDQELLYLKQTHADLFGAALEAGLLSLSKRARTVLRLHFLEGVPVAQIATSYSVSPRSVQRWIVAAQTEVIDQLRSTLGSRLEITGSQLESLMGAMETELVIALRQFFKEEK
jgi:RNA polymerase sigma-70 factor, ECF subfamily